MNSSHTDSIAQVVKVEDGSAWLKINRKSNCSSCSSNSSCGVASLSQVFNRKSILIKVKNILNAKQGDMVTVSYPAKDLIRSAMIAYLIPIITLIAVSIFAKLISDFLGLQTELFVIVCALIGLIGSSYSLRYFRTRNLRMKHKYIKGVVSETI